MKEGVHDIGDCIGTQSDCGQFFIFDTELVNSIAFDYMMLSGYLVLAYLWAQSAVVANSRLLKKDDDNDFYNQKVTTAQFYFDRLLPRAGLHFAICESENTSIPML